MLTPEGHALGTLCVIDRVPRTLDPKQERALRALARQVIAQLELRHDLAVRRRTEEALRTGEEKFRAATETANDAIVSADSHGNIIYMNQGAERTFGYGAADIVASCLPS